MSTSVLLIDVSKPISLRPTQYFNLRRVFHSFCFIFQILLSGSEGGGGEDPTCRRLSTQQSGPGSLPDYQPSVDPYRLLDDDLKYIYRDIRQVKMALSDISVIHLYIFSANYCN